jgi:hypothetical protein
MGTRRLLAGLAVAVFVLGLIGCAENFSGRLMNSRVFSGDLLEKKNSNGATQRVRIEGLDSWQLWHRNTHKGDGATFIFKAEASF